MFAKIFCLGLDIWVPEIVEADVLQSGVLEDLLVEFYHRVRVVHFPGSGRGE